MQGYTNGDASSDDRTDRKQRRILMFDTLPPGVRPEGCEPDKLEPPADPDRHYEARIEQELEDR